MPRPRNLLLCFDAFGTLFKPRHPIAQQYGEVARSLGLPNIQNTDIEKSFKAAFKRESSQNPNYGKHNGLNAEKWWSRVITGTFTPLISANQELPSTLIPTLLHRFGSKEAYELFPDVLPLMCQLRKAQKMHDGRIVVGIITNSDDRVPHILTSLGLRVSSLRYPSEEKLKSPLEDYDIHFSVMSYDVGHEKPSRLIFGAAENMVSSTLGARLGDIDTSGWMKVHVGDDLEKDVEGARAAGWVGVLLHREAVAEKDENLVNWLDGRLPPSGGYQLFDHSSPVGASSLEQLARWLPGGERD